MTYTADVTCKAAWDDLANNPSAVIVDVRTTHEWNSIGIPDLGNLDKTVILAEWQMFPSMQVNPDFASNVALALNELGTNKDDPIYFLCRSGARSQSAASAMSAMGYTNTFNILGGFEGAPDANGIRGNVEGWKYDGLPWKQE